MFRPKLYLARVETLRGNVAHEWRGTTCRAPARTVAPERRAGAFWAWLQSLARAGRAGGGR